VYLTSVDRMIYDECMTKRASYYEQLDAESPYPNAGEQIYRYCDICGLKICINNWPDKKPRTPRIFDLVICVDCDPRWWADRYKAKGYRIAFKRRLRVVNMARIVRAAARHGCIRPVEKWDQPVDEDGIPVCNCFGCAAMKLYSPHR
jgi:hypothetical protein